ncbi:MAG: hypothetical protein AB2551_14925 [Candidatus Thiodiazotropha sp.]
MKLTKSFCSLFLLVSTSLSGLPLVAGELLIESDFENPLHSDVPATSAPADNYIFGTNHLAFWDMHVKGTGIISSCDGKGPYEGNQYWHLQFQEGYYDPCLGTTTVSVNTHSNIGQDFAYPQGTQNRVVLEEAATSDTLTVRFYFRTTGDWTSNNDTDGGEGLKFIRVFGNGGYGDRAAALIKLKNDNDSLDPTWNLYDPGSPPYNHLHFAGVDVQDGDWHSIVFKVTRNNATGDSGNITSTFWIDDWDMSGEGISQTITAPIFGNRFKNIELFANWSADQAEYPMGIDIDKLEVWDGVPDSAPYSYTILNPRLKSSAVVSLADNNVITAGNTTLNLDRYEWGAFYPSTGEIAQGVVVTGTGPFEMGSGTAATDVPAHSSLAGTRFVMPHSRFDHWYYMVSPDADATAQVSVDGLEYSVSLPQGVVVDVNAGETNGNISAVITSDSPILVSHLGEVSWFADASPMPPAATELWGFRSRDAHIGAVEDDTTVSIYASDGTTSTMTLNAGEKRWVNVGDRTVAGQGSAIHLVADKPIGAVQIADGDGSDQTAFFPTSLLSTRFGLPKNTQYIAVACPEADTSVTLYNGNNDPVTSTCSADGNYPGKAYFGSAENDVVGAQQGAYLESDKPIHVIYEVVDSEDEHNLMGTLEP